MKQMILLWGLLLALSPQAHSKEVAGIDLPDYMTAEGASLNLNGAGVYRKWMMDVYVGGLYLLQGATDANAVLAADEPMAIKLQMVSGLMTSEKMKDSIRGRVDTLNYGQDVRMKPQLDQVVAVFDEKIKQGDVFDLVYFPGKGIEIYKNGELKDLVSGDLAFKQVLFGVWLAGEARDPLKQAMLGD